MSASQIAVVGAGVVGCAVAHSLAKAGHQVLVLDRADPGTGGASYGNAGHIAAELVQPLPSRELLFGFWRELFAFGGPVDLPVRRIGGLAFWAAHFSRAAFRREINTHHLAPLVRTAATEFERFVRELGCPELLRRQGHYQVWFGAKAAAKADREAADMARLAVPTVPVRTELLQAVARGAKAASIAGLEFPDSAHVVDPQQVVKAALHSAVQRGAKFERAEVRALNAVAGGIEVATGSAVRTFDSVVVCAGAWSEPLLKPFGLRAPLEPAYGYHVELAEQGVYFEAPLVYMDQKVLVTPMTGRVRASGFVEFSGPGSSPDPRKPRRLRRTLQSLGYRCESEGPSWRGPRPVLPDYLPGIGRAPGPHRLFYAVGHQHIGLTMAPVTAELVASLVAGRAPRHDVTAFDLRRFGGVRA